MIFRSPATMSNGRSAILPWPARWRSLDEEDESSTDHGRWFGNAVRRQTASFRATSFRWSPVKGYGDQSESHVIHEDRIRLAELISQRKPSKLSEPIRSHTTISCSTSLETAHGSPAEHSRPSSADVSPVMRSATRRRATGPAQAHGQEMRAEVRHSVEAVDSATVARSLDFLRRSPFLLGQIL